MDIASSAYKQMSHHPSLFDSDFAFAKSKERPTLKGLDRQRLIFMCPITSTNKSSIFAIGIRRYVICYASRFEMFGDFIARPI